MTKRRLSLKNEMKRDLPHYVMLLPFSVLFFLFILIPVGFSIYLSFTQFDMVQTPIFIGLKNYIRIFTEDDVFMIAFKNTIVLALISGPIGYILSFVLAWLINELSRTMRSIVTLIVYSPVLAGNIYFIWLYIFSSDRRGFLNNLLINLGILSDPIAWLSDTKYAMLIVIIVTIWSGFGVGFLSFISGLQSLDRSYYEAAAIDGLKNRWQELYYVTLPQIGPQLLFGAVMTITNAFSAGAISRTLTGFPSPGYSTHTMVLHISDYGSIRYEMGYASALSMILFILMLVSWLLVNKLLKRFNA